MSLSITPSVSDSALLCLLRATHKKLPSKRSLYRSWKRWGLQHTSRRKQRRSGHAGPDPFSPHPFYCSPETSHHIPFPVVPPLLSTPCCTGTWNSMGQRGRMVPGTMEEINPLLQNKKLVLYYPTGLLVELSKLGKTGAQVTSVKGRNKRTCRRLSGMLH